MPIQTFVYQEDGSDLLANRDRFGLHDEMGVGKTAQVVRAVNKIGARRGIIVAPATLRDNWVREFRKFSHLDYRIVKGHDVHDLQAWIKGRFHILVTGYELATKWTKRINSTGEPIDFVAIDEAHYLKNTESKRSQAILGPKFDGYDGGLIEWADHVWDVSGTRMANDPLDIYTFLRMTWATQLDQNQFTKRYFYSQRTSFGSKQTVRPEMAEELRYLLNNNSIRRTKQQVGIYLPPIFMTDIVVDGDQGDIVQLMLEHPGLEDAIVFALEHGGLSFLDAQHIATLRRLIGTAKAVPYSHMLYDELAGTDEKKVVFGIHVDALMTVWRFLNDNGIKAVILNGQTKEVDRVEAVRAFQEDPDCRVFLGNIKAAGTGLTLTAACEIDMLESDWTPAGNAQAIMRVHRIGQTRQVRARFITLADSIDEVVTRIVATKVTTIAEVDGHSMIAAPPVDFSK